MPNGRNLDLDISGQGGADIQMQVEMGGEGSASNAEAWAVGERHGVPVGSSDPTYHNNSRYYAEQTATDAQTASGAASSAERDASDAEAYSVGKRGGTDVDSSDPAYHNNAKYYNEQAGASAYAAGQAQSAAEATLTKQPKIENGTWWIWNATTSAYVNTNVKATGDAWHVVKTYASVAAMEADYSGTDTHIGDYVMVVNTVEDPDNAKVYIKGNLMWEFVVDMSGATGIQGPAGANAYVHIKFAATQPTQNSDMKNQPDAWIGIYSGNSASAPTAYTSYTWYKIKGDTGETGQTGPSGTSYYVHIRYADQQPTNNNQMKTIPSEWIGIYAGTSATAPSAYTNYTWYKYKGETGQTGQTGPSGADGTSYYVHIRYAAQQPTSDSQMKTTPDAWIGIYSGTSQTAPTAYTSYSWYNIKGATGETGQTGATGATGPQGSPGTGSFSNKSVAIPLSGWTLSSGLYQYTYTDSDITAGTIVTVDFGDDIRDALVGDLIFTVSTGSVLFKTDYMPMGTVNLVLHLAVAVTSANGQSF